MMLPWDYDHSLGCMGAASGSATWTELINLPIDEPVINVSIEDRPLLNALLTNEEYKQRYYAYLDDLISSYFESGLAEEKALELTELLLPYVEKEPSDGVSRERFEAAVESDLDFCAYRTRSIRGQLSGDIPTTVEGQKAAPDTLVDCSDFVSPDSGSLSDLLFPDGIYFEDLVASLVPRINTMSTIAILPFETIGDLMFPSSDGGLVEKLEASGRVQDAEVLRSEIKVLILNFIKDVIALVISPIILTAALVFAFAYGKRHRAAPRKRKGGVKNAV